MKTTEIVEQGNQGKGHISENRRTVERRKQNRSTVQERSHSTSSLRLHERAEFNIPVSLKLNGHELVGCTGDITSHGLRITTDTAMSVGSPMAMQFSFGENFCYMNIAGRVVHCSLIENEKSGHFQIGIKFSAIRDQEQKILASVVQELREHSAMYQKSFLSIIASTDTIAQEAGSLFIPTPPGLEMEPTAPPLRSPAFERRFSPRIGSNLPAKVFPGDIDGRILDLGETGFFLASEKPIFAKNVLVSVKLSSFKKEHAFETLAEIVGERAISEGKFLYGMRFSSSEDDHVSKVRDFIFDCYAKKASSTVKNNEDLKIKIEEFFNKDVRQFHEDMVQVALKTKGLKTISEKIEKSVFNCTNDLLLKGESLEKSGASNACMKKVKETFRELVGCWAYKSTIGKMAHEKPRGYPGDYRIFEIIYNNQPLSEEDIGFYFDKYFLTNAYTEAVRSRKDKMKSILKHFIERHGSSCIRLLNIACGPSKEIRELFTERFVYDKKIIYTGLDHDERALELSRASLNYLPPNIQVRFLKESVLNIFKDESYSRMLGKQDVISILGLAEYLPDRIFKKLIHFLFELLNENGKLVIAFKDKKISFPSIPPDWFCNWSFIRRTEDDLLNIAKELNLDQHSFKIERVGIDECIMFLTLTKI
jgi:hypothetical protein